MSEHNTSPTTLRQAAWSLYRDPHFKQDRQKRQANIDAVGPAALCPECAGTGNALLFIHMPCRHCDGTGLRSAGSAGRQMHRH